MTGFRTFISRVLPLLAAFPAALLAPARTQADTAPQTIGGHPVVQIEAGQFHSCALVGNGWVWCWGRNDRGQLGNGTTQDSDRPVVVATLNQVTAIALGANHSCALRQTGRVICWGWNISGQLGSAGPSFSTVPRMVSGLSDVTQITAGAQHSCALRSAGGLRCWGGNTHGQLGDGTLVDRTSPVRVRGTLATQVTGISAGYFHTCAVRATGRVACWGQNVYGQVDSGTPAYQQLPIRVEGVSNVRQVAAGDKHSCALRNNGSVFCWGDNSFGQLGSTTSQIIGNPPGRVSGLSGVLQISAGGSSNCALRSTGRVFCWGSNSGGQLGDGTRENRTRPVRVVRLQWAHQVSVGHTHSCAVAQNELAFCWGANRYGQLGIGTTVDRRRPVQVTN